MCALALCTGLMCQVAAGQNFVKVVQDSDLVKISVTVCVQESFINPWQRASDIYREGSLLRQKSRVPNNTPVIITAKSSIMTFILPESSEFLLFFNPIILSV